MALTKQLKSIDRVAIIVMILLSFILMGLVAGEQVCGTDCWFKAKARVREFNWSQEEISASDRAFLLEFSRPMNRESVENNLRIEPELAGKFSWSGKRMAYTLENPAPYGTEYQLTLNGAKDRLGSEIKPLETTFKTRDRVFVYLGITGEEKGRLISYNLTEQQKNILTPVHLIVKKFVSYPKRDRILFSAISEEDWQQGKLDQQLYTVTTGYNEEAAPSRQIDLILDNKRYQILDFKLSPDGEKIVVRRAEKNDLRQTSLWLIKADQDTPKRLNAEQGGEFIIPPDSETLALAQGQGIALIPLEEDSNPSNFLPQFGQVLTFSSDGSAAAMVNFNTQDLNQQYTRSLYVVTNRGVEKKLLDTDGSILSCEFSPTATNLYCLLTQVVNLETYQEQPYLVSINLELERVTPLLTLPNNQDITMSLSPDGLAILFDQTMTVSNPFEPNLSLENDSGQVILDSRLWLLVPTPTLTQDSTQEAKLEELPISGINPLWLP